ncbi:uncharacterized protein EDB91DRAFT_1082719 [Suillus paluster]|uniref:uncharacterized protein n=1 Tax=Suillus paluster TaxID=48578 RepID=UPI001B885A4F|nr:uncharacterized protein EDB91DRAFT_1082719 [Suillus paluster]KAG1738321.1 hypothetical protein EDB91DRAFT_1082719 [Suillus paluster]
MAASRVQACISQYQTEAAENDVPSAWIIYFKAGIQWEITLTWNAVPDHIFSSHLSEFRLVRDHGEPSRIVSSYDTPWWMGDTTIPNKPWQWDQSGIEDNGFILPEQLDGTPAPSLVGLKWIRECLVSLIQDHQEGIHDKMVEIDISLTQCRVPGIMFRVPSIEHQGVEYQTLNTKYRIPNDEYRRPGIKFHVSSSGYRASTIEFQVSTIEVRALRCAIQVPNAKCWALTTELQVPGLEYRVPSTKTQHTHFVNWTNHRTEYQVPSSGFWVLGVECAIWVLNAECWALTTELRVLGLEY